MVSLSFILHGLCHFGAHHYTETVQIQEISLLRESNMQLREENKHNFEECKVSLDFLCLIELMFYHIFLQRVAGLHLINYDFVVLETT